MRFTVAKVGEIEEGTGKGFEVGDTKVAVFLSEGKYFAIHDECTHTPAPLSDGTVVGTQVVCPFHGAKFDLENGKALCPPARKPVACYKVEVVGDEIQIEVTTD